MIVPYVFHRDGDPIRHFRRSWITACIKAGLGREVREPDQKNKAGEVVKKGRVLEREAFRIPHDYRRSAARNLSRMGVPERDDHATLRLEDAQCVRPLPYRPRVRPPRGPRQARAVAQRACDACFDLVAYVSLTFSPWALELVPLSCSRGWWPGTESNRRHADFQCRAGEAANHS
jgi:hypothetical protein